MHWTASYPYPCLRCGPGYEGVSPPGSEWTRNPIPDQHDPATPPNFPPPVPGLAGHCCDEGCPDGCGDGFGQIWNIMDRVRVPSRLTPGEYVLSGRLGCHGSVRPWCTHTLPLRIYSRVNRVPNTSQPSRYVYNIAFDLRIFTSEKCP